MQLHHLALGATDVAALAGFYASVFGLEQVREHRRDDGTLRSIWLRLGEGLLMVESIEAGPVREQGLRLPEPGWFLLAFATEDEAESEAVCRAATARGASESHRTGFTRYLVDPEGNRVAVSHFPLPKGP
jgi:catechol 2,3-dioxygenase-like lactoylglutathione lyase family enzyme